MKYIYCLLLLIVAFVGKAQDYKFGKVSKEEIEEKIHPIDSSANAAILYENQNIYIEYTQGEGFHLITEVHKRIKLYNKNGFNFASDEIFLYKKSTKKEELTGLKGVTYNYSEGKIIETKLKKEGIFKNEFSENYDQVKFTMPALAEGSVIEYKYKVTSPFLYSVDRIYLQYTIPIKKKNVSVKFPEYYNYKKYTTGHLPIDLKESKASGRIIINSKTRHQSSGFSKLSTTFSRDAIEYVSNINTIKVTNVPAFKKEPFSGNIENYISSIFYELSYVKFPNEPADYFSTTWEDVVKTIYSSSNFGAELKKSNYYKEDIDNLISKTSDPKRRLMLIYDFVKKKMTWNNRYAVATSKGVKKAYKEGVGNPAEINLMLTSMLSYAGMNAYPVVASTSDKPMALFPTLDGFNYVISMVKFKDGKELLLDATDKYGYPNILPNRVIQGIGRAITDHGNSKLINLRPNKLSKRTYSLLCEIKPEVLKGKLNINYTDNLAHQYRIDHDANEDKTKINTVKTKYGLDKVENYVVKGIKEFGKGVSENFSFIANDQLESIEDEIYFSPLLFLKEKENVFKSEDRKYPVDFGIGFFDLYRINIKIPEGYQVVEYPKSISFKLPDNLGSYTYKTNLANGVLQVLVKEVMNTPIVTSNYYLSLKEFYNQIVQKEEEQVVLKKI